MSMGRYKSSIGIGQVKKYVFLVLVCFSKDEYSDSMRLSMSMSMSTVLFSFVCIGRYGERNTIANRFQTNITVQ